MTDEEIISRFTTYLRENRRYHDMLIACILEDIERFQRFMYRRSQHQCILATTDEAALVDWICSMRPHSTKNACWNRFCNVNELFKWALAQKGVSPHVAIFPKFSEVWKEYQNVSRVESAGR